MAYRAIETTNTITHIPDGIPEGEISVLVFYPGIDVSGKQGRIYMPPLIKDGSPDWFDKYIIVIPNQHSTKWADVKKEYESEMDSRKLKTKNLSLGVFSGSGQNSVDIQGQIPSLGLINFMIMDPSPGDKLKKSVTSVRDGNGGVYMMYNPGNWTGKLKHLGEAQPGVANLVGTANAIRNNDGHMIIPTNFLKTFKDKIELSLSSDVKESSSDPELPKRREKIEATFTFNVEKEDIFVIVSTGTFSTSSGTASGTTASSGIAKDIGELLIVDESELFVFQDESEEFILDDEFTETDFLGTEEEIELELKSEFGDSEGSENSSGVDIGNGTQTDNASSAGGTGERRYQKSMVVNGTKILNGELPDNLLQKLSWSRRKIEKNAAVNFEKLNKAYKEKFGENFNLSGGYRKFEVQNSIFDWKYHNDGINPYNGEQDKKGKGRKIGSFKKSKPFGTAAAKPGTSKHGWGQAVDIGGFGNGPGNEKFDWMEANARKYGWENPSWAKKTGAGYEPWHWEYIGSDLFKA